MTMEIMHIGLPITTPQKNEEYAEGLKVFISGPDDNPMKFEYLRFEADTPMNPDVVNNVHIAYKVDQIAEYIDKYEVLEGPMDVSEELTIVFVKIDGAVCELMEFHN
jgi:hypothetical protein